jgi:uncharacterized protein (DUF1015 family)
MATLHPFRALRPRSGDAAEIAAVPYDVVNTDEARALADKHPLSFLRVSRAEIDLPDTVDPYADAVYQRAAENFSRLKERALVVEDEPSLYFYQLRMGSHRQTGLAGCFSLDEYDRDIIKKHERTRPDKEDDRTRHMVTLRAQTGPVFLTYCAVPDVDAVAAHVTTDRPLFDFDAPDGVRHTIWRVGPGRNRDALVAAFGRIPALYIADGHHRAASAARARSGVKAVAGQSGTSGSAEVTTMLAVAFPHDQVQILPYNRIVKDLGNLTPEQFLERIGQRFTAGRGPAMPASRGDIAMYFRGSWRTLRPRARPDQADAIASLDVSILQDQLLAPILGIADVRTDKRIDFVGGARGVAALEDAVNSGRAAVAFSLFPVTVADLMKVSDAGAIMPPKSTWFEPKLRDGLLIHEI